MPPLHISSQLPGMLPACQKMSVLILTAVFLAQVMFCCSYTSAADICCVLPLWRKDESACFSTCAFLLSVVLCDLPCAGGPVHCWPCAVSMFAKSRWLNTRWLSCHLLSAAPSLWHLHYTSCFFPNAETFTQIWKCEPYFSLTWAAVGSTTLPMLTFVCRCNTVFISAL